MAWLLTAWSGRRGRRRVIDRAGSSGNQQSEECSGSWKIKSFPGVSHPLSRATNPSTLQHPIQHPTAQPPRARALTIGHAHLFVEALFSRSVPAFRGIRVGIPSSISGCLYGLLVSLQVSSHTAHCTIYLCSNDGGEQETTACRRPMPTRP